MTLQDIIDWYGGIDESRQDAEGNVVDLDRMLFMRKQLAVESVKVSNYIYKKEVEYKSTYIQKKIEIANSELAHDGTVMERKAQALIAAQEVAKKSDRLEGEVRGLKIKLDQINKVLDSMSSYINTMRAI